MKYKLNIATTITLIILILTFTNCEKEKRYQRKIDGIWVEINRARSIPGYGTGPAYLGTSWRFDKNDDFFILKTACEKDSTLGGGTYYLNKDTLFISYSYYNEALDSIMFDSGFHIIERFGWTPKRGTIMHLRDGSEFEKCPMGVKK